MEYEIGKVIPNYKGRWKQSIYEDLDVVAFEGKTYISLVNNNSEKPSEESTKWRILLESPISQADVNNLNNIFLPIITDKLEEISKKIQENTDDIKEQRGLVLDSINTSAFVRTKLNEFGQRLSKIEKKLGI